MYIATSFLILSIKELTSEGQDHVTKGRSALINKEDPLHVERHKLAIVYFVKPGHTNAETQTLLRDAGYGISLGY